MYDDDKLIYNIFMQNIIIEVYTNYRESFNFSNNDLDCELD